MKPIERGEVLGLSDYETIRPHFRARVIDEKKRRRVGLGPHMTATFENRDTVLLQVQEMLRTERITREAAIQHEMATYNQLIPGAREVSATVMIEVVEPKDRDAFLDAARGIEQSFGLTLDGERMPATWDPSRVLPDRASAVLYLKFPLTPRAYEALATGRAAKLELWTDHPVYRASVQLSPGVIQSLLEDLHD